MRAGRSPLRREWRSRTMPSVPSPRAAVRVLIPFVLPALALLALASLAWQPSYPYAFTLPVALTQDLGVAQDAATLAVLVAAHAPRIRLPAPGAASLGLIAFVVYALLTPASARRWD